MHRDDLISQVRVRGRLHGRNEARRVIRAVLQAFRQLVPDDTYRQIAVQLPAEIAVGPAVPGDGRPLTREVARQLYVNEPNAAFLSRVVFEQLNAYCHGVTPASVADSLPAEVRALVSARADDPAHRFRRLFPAIGPSAAVLSLRATGPASDPAATEIRAVMPRPGGARARTTRAPSS